MYVIHSIQEYGKKKGGGDYPYMWTWSKAYYKDKNVSIYLSGLWKNPFLFSEETTDKTEGYFYLFLCFLG